MIIVLVVVIVAAIVGIARGGSLDNLASTRFVWVPLLLVGLVVQVVFQVWSPAGISETGALVVILASYAAVVTFLLLNRRLPGMAIAGVGMALNVIVIAANGAMPVSARAVDITGTQPTGKTGIKHELMTEETVLPFLGDTIPVPLVDRIVSVGDVVLAIGIGWLVYARTRKRGSITRGRRARTASG